MVVILIVENFMVKKVLQNAHVPINIKHTSKNHEMLRTVENEFTLGQLANNF